ncbi:ATP synthase subunit K [Borrelia hispanica]|uniref:ATP synthase subunit K n=1 Tax=Borrelia hispanica TaxID=40835 RepID=UPI000464ED61|nr:ATP synthase subunit K [Borrelia hispanica]
MDIGLVGVNSALTISAIGSALGMGAAGSAAIGAWKRCYMQGKSAPFLLIVFVSAPLTQIIYGYILMNTLAEVMTQANPWLLFGAGFGGGVAMAISAFAQGRTAAGACDSFAETGKGFATNLLVLGLIESVALFVMVFLMIFKFV